MAFCTRCGAELPDGVGFCTQCGAPVEDLEAEAFDADGPGGRDDTILVSDEWSDPAPFGETEEPDLGTSGPTPAGTGPQPPVIPGTSPMPDPTPPPSEAPGRPKSEGSRLGTGAIVGIGVGVTVAVIAVAFGIFYFANPLGLTTGIFANSPAAYEQQALEAQSDAQDTIDAAQDAQAQAEEAQKQLETLQQQNEELKRRADQAEQARIEAESEPATSSSGSSGGGSSSSESSSSSGGGITYVHHMNSAPDSQFMFPDSDTRDYTREELEQRSNYELYVGRNEVLARYGRQFIEDDLNDFYLATDWYIPLYEREAFDEEPLENYLNSHEYHNMILMRDIERERGSEYIQ